MKEVEGYDVEQFEKKVAPSEKKEKPKSLLEKNFTFFVNDGILIYVKPFLSYLVDDLKSERSYNQTKF